MAELIDQFNFVSGKVAKYMCLYQSVSGCIFMDLLMLMSAALCMQRDMFMLMSLCAIFFPQQSTKTNGMSSCTVLETVNKFLSHDFSVIDMVTAVLRPRPGTVPDGGR